ncbi:MAG: polyribonucleotide nucleotidyltransferase, partial [Deltaproteobacteria bacterium]
MQKTEKRVKLGENEFVVETGRIAKQADGACLVSYGETAVLVTAVADRKPREGADFLPLTVDYREKTYAAGKIPGGFFKREGRPTETEILICRIIDRSIRPIFPKGWTYETQVIALPLSADPYNPTDVLAATGASIALCLSDIPFDGPLATVRVGRVGGEFVVNPTFQQIEQSDIDLVVSSSEKAIVMVEGDASQVSEDDLVDALMFAFEQCQPLIQMQKQLVQELGKPKRTFETHEPAPELVSRVR